MVSNSGIDTVRDLIDRMAASQPDRAFLLGPETGQVITFKGLQEQVNRLCGLFQQMGLQCGDKVAFLMDNGLFTAQFFLGTMYGGYVSVPLNVRAGVSQLSYTLDHSDAKAVFVERQYDALINEVLAGVGRPVEVVSADVGDCPAGGGAPLTGRALSPVRAEDAALLMYTSGSTGQPKGALHTHKSVLAHGRNSIDAHQLTSADRSLLVLPLYHINAECVTLIPTLLSGGSVVVPKGFAVGEFWNWIDDYQCTWSALVPTIISQLLDWRDPKAENRTAAFQRIRFLRSSSAPLSPSLHREFVDKFNLPLIQAMGSSEAGNVFSNPVPPGTNKIGSPGLPWGFETKIINHNGAELPAGEPGEVLLRGNGMMQGYYKDPNGTGAALDVEGWLHTGDLAYRDEDGYFFVIGRSKELIIKGGVNIAPRQIDEVLESHPAVFEAAAVGIPDRYFGEDVIAFVVLRSDIAADEKELLAFCETRLGHFKTPSRIHLLRELPKGPSGKVQRLRLLDHTVLSTVAAAVQPERVVSMSGNSPASDDSFTISSVAQIISAVWAEALALPQVDPDTNFFALGGHSLLAIQCLSKLRQKLPIVLSLADFFECGTVTEQAELVHQRLGAASGKNVPGGPDSATKVEQSLLQQLIPRKDLSAPHPLSPAQRGLWFLEQLNPNVPVYNEAEAVRLTGELNVDALERAMNMIIDRHEVLRSTIMIIDDVPHAIIHDSWPIRFKRIDLSTLPRAQRDAEADRLLIDEPRIPYDLEAEPAIRVSLLHLGPQEHVLILMMHHIICDWASEGVIWRELSALYRSLFTGEPAALPALPVKHGDYAVWQHQKMTSTNVAEDLDFWERTLHGAPALLELPADRPRPPVMSYQGDRIRWKLNGDLTDALRNLSRNEKTSLFTIFTAALDTLLYRYSGNDDILIGIPLADRDYTELQNIVGYLLRMHVLRTSLSGEMTFRELLGLVQKSALDLYTHRGVPFDQIVQKLQTKRNPSYTPVFQIVLNWRDRDQMLSFIGMEGLAVDSLMATAGTSKFDLLLQATDIGDEIWLELEFNTDIFDRDRMARMLGHYQTLLSAVAADTGGCLAQIPLLTASERHHLLYTWNNTQADFPQDRCIHELFEEQVAKSPDAIAVVFEDQRLSYTELNHCANQLAHHLRTLGVGPDVLVALFLERSLDMVVGMLGVLKAGGAYVPLDPNHPEQRLAYMLADAQPLVLLTQERLQSELPPHSSHVVVIDANSPPTAQVKNAPAPAQARRPRALAYVIYTSGSTGEPKGVEIEHCSLANMLTSMQQRPGLGAEDTMLAITTLVFDIAALEIFLPLMVGARIVIASSETARDGVALIDLIERFGVSVLQATPATLQMLLDAGWTGAPDLKILCGGEAWPEALASQLLPRSGSLWNMYGPTETTVWSAVAKVEAGEPIMVGQSIANTRLYVLDGALQLVPVGVPGELYIGGHGLARGYFHRPELTHERFLMDPFAAEPGARMYRTGDLVRRSPDGTLEFLGRIDHQVKIRGFRIELGEIETRMRKYPGVAKAVVIVREDQPGEKRLVAYFVSEADIATAALRDHLATALPEYMVPTGYMRLEALPLTPNGKLDRKALPPPHVSAQEPDVASLGPSTPSEKILAQIWCEMLDLEQVGLRDNFFDLGGHSLLAVRVIGAINKTLSARLTIPIFYKAPTIEGVAKVLEQKHGARPKAQLIQLQSGRTGLTLYFIGAGAETYRLQRNIGGDLAIFAVDSPIPTDWHHANATVDRIAVPTIEELAELYGEVLCDHAGSSPCVIAGYCFAGKMAFEAARILQRAGGNVSCVILIDANAYAWKGPTRGPGAQSLAWIWQNAAGGTASDTPYIKKLSAMLVNFGRFLRWLLARTPNVVKNRLDKLKKASSPGVDLTGYLDKEGVPIDEAVMSRLRYLAGRSWNPSPLEASGVLLRAKSPDEELLPGYDFANGWRNLFAHGLKIVQVAGDHHSMLDDENIAKLAQQIKAVLDQQEVVKTLRRVSLDNKSDAGLLPSQPTEVLQLDSSD